MGGSERGEGNRTALLFAAILPQEVARLHECVAGFGQRNIEPREKSQYADKLGHDLYPNNLVNVWK